MSKKQKQRQIQARENELKIKILDAMAKNRKEESVEQQKC
jgi:hypothetical protein